MVSLFRVRVGEAKICVYNTVRKQFKRVLYLQLHSDLDYRYIKQDWGVERGSACLLVKSSLKTTANYATKNIFLVQMANT